MVAADFWAISSQRSWTRWPDLQREMREGKSLLCLLRSQCERDLKDEACPPRRSPALNPLGTLHRLATVGTSLVGSLHSLLMAVDARVRWPCTSRADEPPEDLTSSDLRHPLVIGLSLVFTSSGTWLVWSALFCNANLQGVAVSHCCLRIQGRQPTAYGPDAA